MAGGFIEGEILGEMRHYTRDAYAPTQGAAEGSLILGGRLSEDSLENMFFVAAPNVASTMTISVYWFGDDVVYYGPSTFEVTEAAPEVGDVMKGTFSGTLTSNDTGDMQELTNGRFELPRVQ